MCIIILDEFLTRCDFWKRHPKFSDKNNFVAHLVFKGRTYCQKIMQNGMTKDMDAIINKRTYYNIFDMLQEYSIIREKNAYW